LPGVRFEETEPPEPPNDPPSGAIAAWDFSKTNTLWRDASKTIPVSNGASIEVAENIGSSGAQYNMRAMGVPKWVLDPNGLPALDVTEGLNTGLFTGTGYLDSLQNISVCVVATGPLIASTANDSRIWNAKIADVKFGLEMFRSFSEFYFGGRILPGDAYKEVHAGATNPIIVTSEIGVSDYTNGIITLFHDGAQIGESTIWHQGLSSDYSGGQYSYLGTSDDYIWDFDGYIHAVYIYARKLSAEDRVQWWKYTKDVWAVNVP